MVFSPGLTLLWAGIIELSIIVYDKKYNRRQLKIACQSQHWFVQWWQQLQLLVTPVSKPTNTVTPVSKPMYCHYNVTPVSKPMYCHYTVTPVSKPMYLQRDFYVSAVVSTTSSSAIRSL